MLATLLTALGSLALLSLAFGPLERAFPARPGQRVLRAGLAVDLCFFAGQYLVWSSVSLSLLLPAREILGGALGGFHATVAAWPFAVQAALAVVFGDLSVYGFHRACHAFEPLWRFHAVAATLAGLVERRLARGATVVDELNRSGGKLSPDRGAVIAAHNDQVHAVRYELARRKIDPDSVFVSTANKIQAREYDVVLVWHPLAGRRDATAFHLEAGRMCVMLSRHRQACIVVGRAGALRLLEEFPDSDPVFLDEPEKFPDGWQANHMVLRHLADHRVS